VARPDTHFPLFYFGKAFAGIWLVYDLVDMVAKGTQSFLLLGGHGELVNQLTLTQVALIAIQAAWLFGFHPRAMAGLAAGVRFFELSFYSLNDFRYYWVICTILAVSDAQRHPSRGPAPAWGRDVLVLQTAWIYLASAILKMNPPFLSGGSLFVRQNYMLHALNWPFPAFYQKAMASLPFNSVLCWVGAVGEVVLPCLLVAWVFFPKRRPLWRKLALLLMFSIHGFAAAALNVYFFGVSLLVQVSLLTGDRPGPAASRFLDRFSTTRSNLPSTS